MDFFERQQQARSRTRLLEVYFLCAIVGIIISVYLVVAVGLAWGQQRSHYYNGDASGLLWNPRLLLGTALATLGVIACGSGYKISQLAGGGGTVAEQLGGRLVNSNTTDPDERKLMNVVEEMAIASGTPVPQVYVLDRETGINAFAAGHSTRDTAVCVTRGAMKLLTRDELQGVVGHEFSHILNGDMRLNLRLMGLLFGILCIALSGRILLSTRSRKNNALPLLGLALLAIGFVGVFFGKLIKSAVNREREFLADASSVQFTRNPAGLASALKKVGGCGSQIEDPNAEDASHLFFANGLGEAWAGLFATHPPLVERIKQLDPSFDGKFTPVELPTADAAEERAVPPSLGGFPGGAAAMAAPGGLSIQPRSVVPQIGTPTPQHLDYAADLVSKLPPVLTAAARDSLSAVALIYAILLSPDDAMRVRQLDLLQKQTDPAIYDKILRLIPSLADLESRARLPLAGLTLTALRRLAAAQYQQFSDNLDALIKSDGQIELFEYALQKIILRQLEPHFKPPRKQPVQYYVLRPLLPDGQILLSALAHAGQEDPQAAENAFRLGVQQLNAGELQFLDAGDCTLDKVDAALDHLNQGAPQLKKVILEACAATVAADGVIQECEAEMLRAVADTLDCPIPPFLTV